MIYRLRLPFNSLIFFFILFFALLWPLRIDNFHFIYSFILFLRIHPIQIHMIIRHPGMKNPRNKNFIFIVLVFLFFRASLNSFFYYYFTCFFFSLFGSELLVLEHSCIAIHVNTHASSSIFVCDSNHTTRCTTNIHYNRCKFSHRKKEKLFF